MHLFEHDVAVTDAANLQLSYIVPNNVLKALAIAAEHALGFVHNGNTLLERQLKMVPHPRNRHALVKIIGVYAN